MTQMTVEEAMILALSSIHEHFSSQWQVWLDDDAGQITAVHVSGMQVSAEVHDSGIIEYWVALPEAPPLDAVLETLVYVNEAAPPIELVGMQFVGSVDWGGGGGDFLPVMQ